MFPSAIIVDDAIAQTTGSFPGFFLYTPQDETRDLVRCNLAPLASASGSQPTVGVRNPPKRMCLDDDYLIRESISLFPCGVLGRFMLQYCCLLQKRHQDYGQQGDKYMKNVDR